jgi:hypothetical protein
MVAKATLEVSSIDTIVGGGFGFTVGRYDACAVG